MAQCDAQALLDASGILRQFGDRNLRVIMCALLCQLVHQNEPLFTCDANTLLNANPQLREIGSRELDVIICQLLCEILQSGGSGGTCITCGSGAPVAAGTCDCSIYYDKDVTSATLGQFWVWMSNSTWFNPLDLGDATQP